MPGIGIMRAKQKRAGSLGQSSRFCTLGCSGKKIASSQGFGYNNPSRGSMVSLVNAIQKQAVLKKCCSLNKNEQVLSNFFYHQGPNSTVYSNLMRNEATAITSISPLNSNSINQIENLINKYGFLIGVTTDHIYLISRNKEDGFLIRYYDNCNSLPCNSLPVQEKKINNNMTTSTTMTGSHYQFIVTTIAATRGSSDLITYERI